MSGEFTSIELLVAVIARLLEGCRHVVTGASSPIPGAAALLARDLSGGATRVTVLGSRRNNSFTNGGVELFDLAAQEENALAPKPAWTAARLPPKRLDALLNAIIGFHLPFDRLEGKAKLSQNRSSADREAAIEGLEARGDAASVAVAASMRKALGEETG